MRLGVMQSELDQLRLDTTYILDNLSTGVLTVDGEGGRVSAEDFAILACHALGTTSEFLMF